jgi:DNA repair exonuclease SbcCD nuclease subunit
MIDFKARQVAAIERINRETEQVVNTFPELDPDSDKFDPDLSDTIYDAVEAKIKSDPTASVKQFVNKQMKLYKREASREEQQERQAITKQASESAIRPTQTKSADTKFEDLSIDEMRSRLGYAQ